MKKIIIAGTLIILLFGCASAKGNKGAEARDIGLHTEVPISASIGRDIALSSAGSVGLTLVALCLCGLAYAAVRKIT